MFLDKSRSSGEGVDMLTYQFIGFNDILDERSFSVATAPPFLVGAHRMIRISAGRLD